MTTATHNFDEFLKDHSLYQSAYATLEEENRLLAVSAQLVYELHRSELGQVAEEILAFIGHRFGTDFMKRYMARVNAMAELQKRFDANPSAATLGDPGARVDPDDYGLALLLSIVLTNHRFEMMRVLRRFLGELSSADGGSIVSIGSGAGYELKLIAQALPNWEIESYDTDSHMQSMARQLLGFFKVAQGMRFASLFPLEQPSREFVGKYDAVVLCEVLEHLTNAAGALYALRECLKDTGRMFVTMAINIAQEDHVFLYPDVKSCRSQMRDCGFAVEYEWLAPQSIRFLPDDREADFRKGNYIAVVSKSNNAA